MDKDVNHDANITKTLIDVFSEEVRMPRPFIYLLDF